MLPYILTFLVLRGCDATTTAAVMSQGGREANILLPQSIPANVALQSAESLGIAYVLQKAQPHHPTAVKAAFVALIAGEAVVVAHNLKQLR